MKLDSHRSNLLVIGCLIHAGLITALWILVFKFDAEFISGKVWMGIAAIWPLWIIAALASPKAMMKKWAIAGGISIMILLPAIPTLYTFLAWTIGGFAP